MSEPPPFGVGLLCWLLAAGFLASSSTDARPIEDPNAGAVCEDARAARSDSEEPPTVQAQPGIGTIAWTDTSTVLAAPAHWSGKNWLLFGGTVAAVAAVGFVADERMRKFTQDHKSGAADQFTKVVEPFGAEYSYGVLGVYGIAGFLFHDAAAKDIAIDGAMTSILAAGIITPVSKFVIGRSRPRQDEGASSFHPFNSNNSSFPSGHATQAFAVASVISAHSDVLWVNISAYTLASLVGYARLYHDAHWVSDISAGALIGTVVGHAVVAINTRLRNREGTRIAISPITERNRRGANLAVSF